MGGIDSFSNGIHLNVIHNASDPVAESTKNIEAIDDVTKSILNTTDKLVISFIRCGAGAGGVMLALAGDLDVVRFQGSSASLLQAHGSLWLRVLDALSSSSRR